MGPVLPPGASSPVWRPHSEWQVLPSLPRWEPLLGSVGYDSSGPMRAQVCMDARPQGSGRRLASESEMPAPLLPFLVLRPRSRHWPPGALVKGSNNTCSNNTCSNNTCRGVEHVSDGKRMASLAAGQVGHHRVIWLLGWWDVAVKGQAFSGSGSEGLRCRLLSNAGDRPEAAP